MGKDGLALNLTRLRKQACQTEEWWQLHVADVHYSPWEESSETNDGYSIIACTGQARPYVLACLSIVDGRARKMPACRNGGSIERVWQQCPILHVAVWKLSRQRYIPSPSILRHVPACQAHGKWILWQRAEPRWYQNWRCLV